MATGLHRSLMIFLLTWMCFLLSPCYGQSAVTELTVDPQNPSTGTTPDYTISFKLGGTQTLMGGNYIRFMTAGQWKIVDDTNVPQTFPSNGFVVTEGGNDVTGEFDAVVRTSILDLTIKPGSSLQLTVGPVIVVKILSISLLIGTVGAVTTNSFLAVTTSIVTQQVAVSLKASALSAGGDPITFFNGTKVKYWLPLGKVSLLVGTPDIQLSASVLPGPSQDYQWFDKFFLSLPDDWVFARVSVNRNRGRLLNGSASRRNRHSRQLDILVGDSTELLQRPSLHPDSFVVPGTDVRMAYGMLDFHPPRLHGTAHMEYLQVETNTISFVVFASHAGTEFPDDVEMQVKYAHLDWWASEARSMHQFFGILPELWGVVPLSETVAAMKTAPSEAGLHHAESCSQRQ